MDPSFSGFTPGFPPVLEFSLKQAMGLPLSMLQPSSKPGVQRPQQALCHPARRSWAILQRLLSKPFYPIPPPAALLKNWGGKKRSLAPGEGYYKRRSHTRMSRPESQSKKSCGAGLRGLEVPAWLLFTCQIPPACKKTCVQQKVMSSLLPCS